VQRDSSDVLTFVGCIPALQQQPVVLNLVAKCVMQLGLPFAICPFESQALQHVLLMHSTKPSVPASLVDSQVLQLSGAQGRVR
jgi:hypothetical protein